MKTDLSKYNNSWYKPGKNKLIRALWFLVNACVFQNRAFPVKIVKPFILRLFGADIGKSVIIKPSVNIKYPWKLKIGDHSWIGECVWIDNLDFVEIGKNCCLSQGVLLLCGNHNYKSETFDLVIKPIVLHDGVWIGAKSIVCAGVVCGAESVLSVNSVATGNLDANWIYRGNPAEKLRERYNCCDNKDRL